MSGAYYNDNDPLAAAWLRELVSRGLIADGEVDERSILDIRPEDLKGFTQCHFFAGIGGWSYSLRLAGVPDDTPLWTGSPPCQPFSNAGRREGKNDERHLAPHFVELVRSCGPKLLFGEQVASSDVFGKAAKPSRNKAPKAPEWAWLDDLSDRLEAAHYAVGASDIPAAGVGAPHIRQRTFFGAVRLADAYDSGLEGRGKPGCQRAHERSAGTSGLAGRLADTERRASERHRQQVGGAQGEASPREEERQRVRNDVGDGLDAFWLADADGRDACAKRQQPGGQHGQQQKDGRTGDADRRSRPTNSFWGDADWLLCRDDKWRPVESSTQQMADGLSKGMGHLRLELDGEEKDGSSCETNSRKVLQDLWDSAETAEIQRALGRPLSIQEESLLRSGVHGRGLRRDDQGDERQEQSSSVRESSARMLRVMWADGTSCSSSRRKPTEQQSRELAEPLRFLSQEGTPPHGCYPLARGVRHRSTLLRGYGNAINPYAAAVFIEAFLDSL